MSSTPNSPNSPVSSSHLRHAQDAPALAGAAPTARELQEFAEFSKRIAAKRPPFLRALARDALVFAYHRGEITKLPTRFQRGVYALILPFRASEYLGLALYRLRILLKGARIPFLPALMNATCAIVWGIRIGDFPVLEEGVYIPHGQLVIDGLTLIGRGSVLCPWITIGLLQGDFRGPQLEEGVFVGTGAKILGPVHIGYGARIGANAVVLSDVPAWSTAIGAPARTISQSRTPDPAAAGGVSEETACAPS